MVSTWHYQLDYHQDCTYRVRQYPWHDLEGYTTDKQDTSNTPLHIYFNCKTYNLCLKKSSQWKTSGP
jgi:hypothetical protein